MSDSFSTRSQLNVGGKTYDYFSLPTLGQRFDISHLPYSMKILLENLLRHEDGGITVGKDHIEAVARWNPAAEPDTEIAFMPARVVLQDFTGVPCVVDLAAMRDAVVKLGGSPEQINPQIPSELVIDHSVQVDVFGKPDALDLNGKIEFQRNQERYGFLRWGQKAFDNFKVVPPNTGIVHQVNLENLARVVMTADKDGKAVAYPDTVFGTDSHTTMINGIGVLGWGVGGIEAEAAMLGQPSSMLIPQVVGFKLTGKLPEGATATDLVLTVTQMLRKLGVVGKFVEFYGDGLQHLPLADRATIGNMAPEYGATCGIFPIDAESLNYLRLSGRSEEQIDLVEAYAKAQGLWHEPGSPHAQYSTTLELDMGTVKPSLAGPKRPQDRVLLEDVQKNYREALVGMTSNRDKRSDDVSSFVNEGGGAAVGNEQLAKGFADIEIEGRKVRLKDGAVVIAAITSCTNTSNPSVLLAAGLLAKKAVEAGLKVAPHIKTSLAPGSRVVTKYLEAAGLLPYLEKLGFGVTAYGCTTCIGNAGDLTPAMNEAIVKNDVVAAAVLSGNRNFEARIHPNIRANFLASPPRVVAYAIAGNVTRDLMTEPVGKGKGGKPVYLGDIWPTSQEIEKLLKFAMNAKTFKENYADVKGAPGKLWEAIKGVAKGEVYNWPSSTYIAEPPFFENFSEEPQAAATGISGARALGVFGDSITTDHISPAGSIKESSPAGKWLQANGVLKADFNSYGSRRGNHEIMMRGTFANVRIKNLMIPAKEDGSRVEGGITIHQPSGEEMSIYDAAMKYVAEGTPTMVFGGEEYGTGSSRDWAAKGTQLLGVKAVIARSFERIHRSNLVGMGVLPLQFLGNDSVQSLGITGEESFDLKGLEGEIKPQQEATLVIHRKNGQTQEVKLLLRIDTPIEVDYYKHGGILPFVLRQLLAA
ncbi:aconitate hydratase AcnA [uncultured Stenotrophomonas sp.]|uniref:aconitate hydratase AcnA n=2 Tax=Gammaproteobacteria TaxID=1236 RepID=UPI00259062EF|nr:aconitate hydratase AcnA [uncultured Stenotrophomonas sp.]